MESIPSDHPAVQPLVEPSDTSSDEVQAIVGDAIPSLALLEDSKKRKRDSERLSGAAKIESIYASLDSIRSVAVHLQDVGAYLEATDDSVSSNNKLVIDCIRFAFEQIEKQVRNISDLANNTREKQQGKQCHAKLSKLAKLEERHQQSEAHRHMKTEPRAHFRLR